MSDNTLKHMLLPCSDGDKYDGEWRNDERHGKGAMIYCSKDSDVQEKYEGEWHEGRMQGRYGLPIPPLPPPRFSPLFPIPLTTSHTDNILYFTLLNVMIIAYTINVCWLNLFVCMYV